jgi:hypothetical protein
VATAAVMAVIGILLLREPRRSSMRFVAIVCHRLKDSALFHRAIAPDALKHSVVTETSAATASCSSAAGP